MKFLRKCSFVILAFLLTACSVKNSPKTQSSNSPIPIHTNTQANYSRIKENIINKYKNKLPHQWGESLSGIYRHLETKQKVIALTFDACGGPKGSGYDADIINYLTQLHVPATLFMNSRWIDANYHTFMRLSQSPLFEIENHGFRHRPLSVTGKSAWGIKGTKNLSELVDEVLLNQYKIKNLTGKTPKFFRSGTAFYDEIGVNVVRDLGEHPVGYSVLGDAGATYTKEQVRQALLSSKPGSIVIMHMNRPAGYTSEGMKEAIPELIKRGYKFVKLTEFPLKK